MPGSERTILHLDLDCFFVSVERIKDPSLIGKPVIIGATSDRGVVTSCSYEARSFGVHSAQQAYKARRLCPNGVFLRGNMEDYSYHSRLVTDIIREEAPLFEKSSIDEFFIDLTGMDRYFGSYKWALHLKDRITRETGLPISFGLSNSKMMAKIATSFGKPNGSFQVPRGTEKEFLAPMKVGKIPFIGESACKALAELGVDTVADLAACDPARLEKRFGKLGPIMWRKANAIDESPVIPWHDAKSVSVERTFHQNTTDTVYLRNLIAAMVEKLSFELREDQKLAGCVTVKVRYADFTTVSKQAMIPLSASDHVFTKQAHELFDQLYQRDREVRLLGVRLSHFTRGHQQINMFEDTPATVDLYHALDNIKKRHGHDKIARASGWGSMSYRKAINPFSKK